jgi:hypothetical protein
MSGIDNLKPPQSTEEARRRGKKGGIASGRARRERKSIREGFNAILSAPVKDKTTLAELKSAGADKNALGLLLLRIYQQAINGDMQAAKLLLTAIGEADPIANEATKAKIDLAFLRMEWMQGLTEEPEPNLSFLEALGVNISELIPEVIKMGGTIAFMNTLTKVAQMATVNNVWNDEADKDPRRRPAARTAKEPTPEGE